MKADNPSDQIPQTKEEGIAALQALAKELGHNPKKSELPEQLRNRIRVLFGKWCYAQAEAGFVIPSEKVQEKRRKREEHKRQVAERQKAREEKKRAARRQKQRAGATPKPRPAAADVKPPAERPAEEVKQAPERPAEAIKQAPERPAEEVKQTSVSANEQAPGQTEQNQE